MQIERISGKYGKKTILIDDEDFPKLQGWGLYIVYHSASKNFCAKLYRYEQGKQISVYLHRFLLDCGTADVVQHLNENTLDCRRFNIKKITYSDKLKMARNHVKRKININERYIKGGYMSIKRYDIMSNSHDSWFVERDNGNYCLYGDYKQLESEKAELEKRISADDFHILEFNKNCVRLESEKAELVKAYEKRGILLDRTIDDYNILLGDFKKLESEKDEILKMIRDLSQSTTCNFRELDEILNKFNEK